MVVTEFFQKADYYVDLHCGTDLEGLVSMYIALCSSFGSKAAKSREMAETHMWTIW